MITTLTFFRFIMIHGSVIHNCISSYFSCQCQLQYIKFVAFYVNFVPTFNYVLFITFWYKQNWQLFRLFLAFSKVKMSSRKSSFYNEEDKIKEMMSQSDIYGKNTWIHEKKVPPNYVCNRCHVPGHFIQNCPKNEVKKDIVKRSTGIPRSFLEPVGSSEQSGSSNVKVNPQGIRGRHCYSFISFKLFMGHLLEKNCYIIIDF